MTDTSKIKIMIIEDNKESLNLLTTIIEHNFTQIEIAGTASTIVDALRKINTIKPELVLLDIELKDGYSFEILDQLPNLDFEIIFVTAFDNFHKKAMDYYALNYITKPILESKLVNTIHRYTSLKERLFTKAKYDLLQSFLKKNSPFFLINTGKEHISLKISDIIKIEADGTYTYFFLENKSYLASNSLKHYEALFAEKGFFKPNRSTLVNLEHVKRIYKKESIILSNNDSIPVSVRNKSKLKDLLNQLS